MVEGTRVGDMRDSYGNISAHTEARAVFSGLDWIAWDGNVMVWSLRLSQTTVTVPE